MTDTSSIESWLQPRTDGLLGLTSGIDGSRSRALLGVEKPGMARVQIGDLFVDVELGLPKDALKGGQLSIVLYDEGAHDALQARIERLFCDAWGEPGKRFKAKTWSADGFHASLTAAPDLVGGPEASIRIDFHWS